VFDIVGETTSCKCLLQLTIVVACNSHVDAGFARVY